MHRIIIGLVGPIASGKSVVAKFFRDKNFSYFLLSDRVREEARKRGLKLERETLQNIGDELRKKYGNDILVIRTMEMIKENDNNIVIDSIRNPGEVISLKEKLNIFIIGITAPRETRLKWFLKRSRESDPKTKGDFYKVDERDSGEGQEAHGQQVGACLKMSDLIIENTGTLEDLSNKIGAIFYKLKQK